MLRNAKVVFQNLLSTSSFNSVRMMTSNIEPLLHEQPLIEEEKEKPTKRPPSENLENDNAKQAKTEGFVRIKRKNAAMLMGYRGLNYVGMQRNKHQGMNTIEENLLSALRKADLITDEAFEVMQTISFQRAARTDKGVSAAGQIVNMKLPEEFLKNPDKDVINKHLPEDIRIFAIRRVTKGFNSKSMCDARTYAYTLPTYVLSPSDVKFPYECRRRKEEDPTYLERAEKLSIIDGKHCYEYRITKDKLEKLSNVLKKFEGSKNFHNFTSKVRFLDPRSRRFIINFVCSEPFVDNGVEFITLEIKGQSFMLHQIRKMVGTVIAVMRDQVGEDIFDRCFNEAKLDIPRAPGLGLILKTVHMDYYNRRYGTDGIHETLEWTECEDELNNFFRTYILQNILDTEIQEKNMLINFLASLHCHTFDVREETEAEENEDEDEEERIKDAA